MFEIGGDRFIFSLLLFRLLTVTCSYVSNSQLIKFCRQHTYLSQLSATNYCHCLLPFHLCISKKCLTQAFFIQEYSGFVDLKITQAYLQKNKQVVRLRQQDNYFLILYRIYLPKKKKSVCNQTCPNLSRTKFRLTTYCCKKRKTFVKSIAISSSDNFQLQALPSTNQQTNISTEDCENNCRASCCFGSEYRAIIIVWNYS